MYCVFRLQIFFNLCFHLKFLRIGVELYEGLDGGGVGMGV